MGPKVVPTEILGERPARPVFGLSNKRLGTLVVLDDGTVLERRDGAWVEGAPLPRTTRAAVRARRDTQDRQASQAHEDGHPVEHVAVG